MNRPALVASASLVVFARLVAGEASARADDSRESCAAIDTCDGISIGGGCTTRASDAGAASGGFCAPSSECDGSAILCLPALGLSDAGGDAGACVSDVSCTAKDAGDTCTMSASAGASDGGGTAGACVLSTCTNGGSIVTCGAATSTYGCDGKQANAPCMTGPGNAGFCIPLTLDDGSVDELECDVDVATDGPDCRIGGSGSGAGQLSTAATIGAGLLLGLALTKKRDKKRKK